VLSAEILQRSGFARKQCPLCKSYFWTSWSDYCGDQPCVPYGFIRNPPSKVTEVVPPK